MKDLIIVGAGPAGLSVAIEAQKAGLDYLLIEKGGLVNSIQHFPSEMAFFSTPELLEIGSVPFTASAMRPTRTDGLEYYMRVAEHFKLRLSLFNKVLEIRQEGSTFHLRTEQGDYQAKHVVVATGYYDNPNLLNIPGETLPKVSHYYNEPFQYYRQEVAIVGGKNSAAIAALELFRHGASVTLIHRREKLSDGIKYWILPDIENRIKEKSVTAFFSTTLLEVRDREVVLENAEKGTFTIANDFVFVLTGYHPDVAFLQSIGVQIENETLMPVHNPQTFETNVAGLYIAGSMAAGKNNNKIFIENGRLHGKAIIDSILQKKK
jgi:bacillithiol disulfide reductase